MVGEESQIPGQQDNSGEDDDNDLRAKGNSRLGSCFTESQNVNTGKNPAGLRRP